MWQTPRVQALPDAASELILLGLESASTPGVKYLSISQ